MACIQDNNSDVVFQNAEQIGKSIFGNYLAIPSLVLEDDSAGRRAVAAEVDDIRLVPQEQLRQIVCTHRELGNKFHLVPHRAESNLLANVANLCVDSQWTDDVHRIRRENQYLHLRPSRGHDNACASSNRMSICWLC